MNWWYLHKEKSFMGKEVIDKSSISHHPLREGTNNANDTRKESLDVIIMEKNISSP